MRIHGYLPVQVHTPIPSFKWVFPINFWEWKLSFLLTNCQINISDHLNLKLVSVILLVCCFAQAYAVVCVLFNTENILLCWQIQVWVTSTFLIWFEYIYIYTIYTHTHIYIYIYIYVCIQCPAKVFIPPFILAKLSNWWRRWERWARQRKSLVASCHLWRMLSLHAILVGYKTSQETAPILGLFELLPSGRCYRSAKIPTSRFRDSFFPRAINILNSYLH